MPQLEVAMTITTMEANICAPTISATVGIINARADSMARRLDKRAVAGMVSEATIASSTNSAPCYVDLLGENAGG